MKSLYYFLRLIRWPNLFFILLAESLFHFCIYKPLFPATGEATDFSFYLILVSNILIAAGGYVINDYFDINIDQINKPEKVVVGSHISRRWVIFWHMCFSILAIYILVMVFPFKEYWHLHLCNVTSIILLWFYSTNFKKDFLIGNVIIAILTAWSISVVYFSKFTFAAIAHPVATNAKGITFFKLMLLYSIFAFILTLIREALKDMEDVEGDKKFGCKTLPIVWGLKPTKVYVAIWLIVVIVALFVIQLLVIPFGWWVEILYCIIAIITPLSIVLFKLKSSFSSDHFKQLSMWIKVAMFFGIMSMIFFSFLF